MKGTNTLCLNEATLIQALQEYLDKRMEQYAPFVHAVTPTVSAFLVVVSDEEPVQ